MLAAQQELPPIPTIPSLEVRILRAKLILEEALEIIEDGLGLGVIYQNHVQHRDSGGHIEFVVIHPGNLIQIADGCADLKVVADGCALACGIDLEPVMAEVHRSNMSKFIGGHRREDGKFCKGLSYSPADIGPILEAQKTPADPLSAVQTPPEAQKSAGEAPGAATLAIRDPRQAGEELVCEYRGFQITRFRPHGFPVLHYFNGEAEHGLSTNLGGEETILAIIKEGIDEFLALTQ